MKNSLYLLLFVMTFIACDNSDKYIQEAATEQIVEKVTEKSETAIEETVYDFVAEKGDFELNENFHVMAMSGLRMRATPELKGKTILTIPYDGIVERVDNDDYGVLEIEEIKGFKIEGNWIKVRHDGKDGYVFDGFLTKFPLPKIVTYNDFDNRKYDSSFDYYFRTEIGGTSGRYDIEKYEDCESEVESDCACGYSQDFGPINYYTTNCSEGGGNYEIEIEGLSLTEAYFIIKALDLNSILLTNDDYQPSEIITYDTTPQQINIEADGAGCYTTITVSANNVIKLDIYCGC
jgi:hypothetical protein